MHFLTAIAYRDGMNLRAAPTTDAKVLRVLRYGDAVTIRPGERVEANGFTFVPVTASDGLDGYGALRVGATPGFSPMPPEEVIIDPPIVALGVPYVAQMSSTANHYRNDCACACALMCLRFAYARAGLLDPILLTVDELAAKTTLPLRDNGLTSEQMVTLLRGYGATAQKVILLTTNMVRGMLKAGTPVVCLVNYKWINPVQKTNLGHFMVITGYGAKGLYANDPYLLGQNAYVLDAALDHALQDVSTFATTPNQGVILTREA